MGYYSEVALCIRKEHKTALMSDPAIVKCLSYVDTTLEDDTGILFYWDDIKWYDDREYIAAIMNFIKCRLADCLFIRLGEEMDDVEEMGSWESNPFNLGCYRGIEFNKPAKF